MVQSLRDQLRSNQSFGSITFGDQSSAMINRSDFTEGLIRRIDLKD